MNNTETRHAIHACISQITNLVPDIWFRKGSSSVMISWENTIPDELATTRIEEALKQFGKPLPIHYREANFVSFEIIR